MCHQTTADIITLTALLVPVSSSITSPLGPIPCAIVHPPACTFTAWDECRVVQAQMREHLALVSDSEQSRHVRTLINSLAAWAEATDNWQPVLELPLGQAEEAELVVWLKDEAHVTAASGTVLAALHLQRGRIAQALLAYQQHPGPGQGHSSV